MLTAARSGEVRFATWDEIDLVAAVWTVPASRMKANREHRVPLGERAVEILNEAPQAFGDANPLVFRSPRGKALSDMTLSKLVREQGIAAVPHGFRSSFRDWAAERTNHPREVVETALAHVVKNKVEAAYARSDLFERRRRLMDDWAAYLDRGSASRRLAAALEPISLRERPSRSRRLPRTRIRHPTKTRLDLPPVLRIHLHRGASNVLLRAVARRPAKAFQVSEDPLRARTSLLPVPPWAQLCPDHVVNAPALRPRSKVENTRRAFIAGPMSRARLNPVTPNAFTLREMPPSIGHITHGHQRPKAPHGLCCFMKHKRYSSVPRLTSELHANKRTIRVPRAPHR